MNLKAKLVQVLPLVTGQGKNGEWRKLEFIVETDGQYPQKVCLSVWGDKIDESQMVIGNILSIDFDPQSREYNGRWFTELRAWKISLDDDSNSNNKKDEYPPMTEPEEDILPF